MATDVGSKRYWFENSIATGMTVAAKRPPRPGVQFTLDGDWICKFLDVSFRDYYTDFDFQWECRQKASEASMEALGLKVPLHIDFGTVLDASIYGGELHFPENAPPSQSPAFESPADIKKLVAKMDEHRDLKELGLVPKLLEWREKIKKKTGKNVPIGVSIKGSATLAAQIAGMTECMMYLAMNEGEMLELMKLIQRTTIRYVRQLRRIAGIPPLTLAMANDMAGMVSPGMYEKFFKPVEKRLYNALCPARAGRFYHADSKMNHQLGHLRDLELNMVNFGPSLTVKEIREKMPGSIIVGHIPPTEVLANGTPQEVLECGVSNIVDAYTSGGKIILSSAGSVNPGTSFENLRAMMQAPLEFAGDHAAESALGL